MAPDTICPDVNHWTIRLLSRWLSASELSTPEPTAVVLGEVRELPVRPLPQGRGMFVGAWGAFKSEAQVEAMVRDSGIDYLLILGPWHNGPGKRNKYWNTGEKARKKVEAAKRGGAKIHVWGWPHPATQVQFVDELAQFSDEHAAISVCMDPEKLYYGEPKAMVALIRLACAVFHGRGQALGVSSYGATWYHRTFPWAQMAGQHTGDRPDYAIPQVYDSKNSLGPGYPAKGVQAYKDLALWKVFPGFGVYGKTPAQFAAHLDSLPAGTCCGWSGRQLTKKKIEILKEYDTQMEAGGLA